MPTLPLQPARAAAEPVRLPPLLLELKSNPASDSPEAAIYTLDREPLERAGLAEAIRQKLQGRAEHVVLVQAARALPYRVVAQAVSAARMGTADQVSLLTTHDRADAAEK